MTIKMFPVVILAGGLGTRLHPITQTIPKSLVNVCGEPFIAHQLRYLKTQHITDVILCVGHLGDMIQDFLTAEEWTDFNITYSFDGDHLRGTAGSIKNALNHLPQSFFVLYGDSYLPCDFLAVQKHYMQAKKLALMSVFKNHNQLDKSNVVFSNGHIFDYNKKVQTPSMHYIDYGLSILHKEAFDFVEQQQFYDLADLYQKLLKQEQLTAYEIMERFYEVGSFSGIDELTLFLGKKINGIRQTIHC